MWYCMKLFLKLNWIWLLMWEIVDTAAMCELVWGVVCESTTYCLSIITIFVGFIMNSFSYITVNEALYVNGEISLQLQNNCPPIQSVHNTFATHYSFPEGLMRSSRYHHLYLEIIAYLQLSLKFIKLQDLSKSTWL